MVKAVGFAQPVEERLNFRQAEIRRIEAERIQKEIDYRDEVLGVLERSRKVKKYPGVYKLDTMAIVAQEAAQKKPQTVIYGGKKEFEYPFLATLGSGMIVGAAVVLLLLKVVGVV